MNVKEIRAALDGLSDDTVVYIDNKFYVPGGSTERYMELGNPQIIENNLGNKAILTFRMNNTLLCETHSTLKDITFKEIKEQVSPSPLTDLLACYYPILLDGIKDKAKQTTAPAQSLGEYISFIISFGKCNKEVFILTDQHNWRL